MARFKVLTGSHYHGKREYKNGEVVESDRPLDKIFVLKFQKLEDDEDEAKPKAPLPPPAPVANIPEPEEIQEEIEVSVPATKKPAPVIINKKTGKR